jgi:hypothetical protein
MICHIRTCAPRSIVKTVYLPHHSVVLDPRPSLLTRRSTTLVSLVARAGLDMTRPKVPEDKRQRIARACDSCKRRKQKVRRILHRLASAGAMCKILSRVGPLYTISVLYLIVARKFCQYR